MHAVYDNWPQIAKESYESDLKPIDFKDIDHIVFAGRGAQEPLVIFFLPFYQRLIFM